MKKLMVILLAACLVSAGHADQTKTYGWEDPSGIETILGKYGNVDDYNVGSPDPVYAGDRSLKLVDQSSSGPTGTPQAYVAWIKGLEHGDQVTASFWCYDTTPSGSPSARIWGHYTSDNDNINSHAGSADGSNTYPDGTGWSQLSYTWTFDAGTDRTGLVIEARTYSTDGDTVWIDDISVTAPDGTTIILPGEGESSQDDPNDLVDHSYDWNDGNGTLLTYYDGNAGYDLVEASNVIDPAPDANSISDRALVIVVAETGYSDSTPAAKARIAWIKGLQTGDKIKAKIAGYDADVTDYQSIAIGAVYCSDNDVTAYEGDLAYAENSTSDGVNGWNDLEYEWTYAAEGDPNRAVLIEAVLWPDYDYLTQEYYVDDVNVMVPSHATVIFPDDMYKPTKTETFGWESPAFDMSNTQPLLVGTYNAVDAELMIDAGAAEGTQYVKVTEADVYQTVQFPSADAGHFTGQAFVAWVTGLEVNDQVYATIKGKALNSNSSLGLSGHYTSDSDIQNYAGDAGRTWVFAEDDTSWTTLKKLWVVSGKSYIDAENNERIPNGLVVEIRPYDIFEEGGYIDDLTLVVPSYATVTFPDKSGAPICLGPNDQYPEYDLNDDCKVDLTDISLIASEWLKCSQAPSSACGN